MKKRPENRKKVVLIGSGKVATSLASLLTKNGFEIVQVYSRLPKSAALLAGKFNAHHVSSIEKIVKTADLYIIAINDDALQDIAEKLKLKNSLVVHTSGMNAVSVLKKTSSKYGVLYPLQTFSGKEAVQKKELILLIEGCRPVVQNEILAIASKIADKVMTVSSEDRQWIHLAAVFANNFTNHMYVIASEILNKKGYQFNLLEMLLLRSLKNAITYSPAISQTGPAIRGDSKTMQKHLALLKGDKKKAALYKLISRSISGKLKIEEK